MRNVEVTSAPGRIGAWDLAVALDTREGADQLAPRRDRQSFFWVTDGELRLTGPGGFNEPVSADQVGVFRGASISGSGSVTGARLDALGPADGTVEIFTPEVFTLRGVTTALQGEARVLVGTMFGRTSPVSTEFPLVAAELRLAPGAEVAFTLEESFEYGLLPLGDGILVQNVQVPAGDVAYAEAGGRTWGIKNQSTGWVRAVVLGGEPL
ncbi:hypothetical protein JZY91_10680 [Corynebacterium sp. CNCTC7651]|uniref:hypothetical protein n=1 Tax=Corynebacterium sp. CNCTC7651 TaxID=2815361 RepID=UPI001F26C015|nr:hypothetical protein [Corynebacterium sp. CNCTC7651]UIZ92105.1 hypothetical protein JZY91_10680 [Corynebacterium sp. CNCTC7651]